MHRIERTASGPSSTATYSSRPRAFHLRRSINQSRHWRFRCEPPCSRSCTALAHRFLGAIDFYPRDAVLAQLLAMGLCLSVCLSVCVCPCLSQVGVLIKRQNVGSHTHNTTRYHRESSFLLPKISAKFERGHPLRGRRMQVGCQNRRLSTNNRLYLENGTR